MATYHLLYNPVAGRGRVANGLQRALDLLAARRLDVSVHVTTGPGDAYAYVSNLPAQSTVLAMGGDGTVQQAAAACICTERTLGILPAGSGDDFAYALGIDRNDLEGAVERIGRGCVKQVDTGVANGLPFINAAGTGFDAEVAVAARQAPPFLREKNAYLYGVFSRLRRVSGVHATVEVDGQLVHDGPSLLVSVQNGPRAGGAFRLAPAATPDDGLFDVVIAGQFSQVATLGILSRVMAGRHVGHPRVIILRGRRVRIRWEKPRPAHLEGELLAPTREYEMELRPRSLRVLV